MHCSQTRFQPILELSYPSTNQLKSDSLFIFHFSAFYSSRLYSCFTFFFVSSFWFISCLLSFLVVSPLLVFFLNPCYYYYFFHIFISFFWSFLFSSLLTISFHVQYTSLRMSCCYGNDTESILESDLRSEPPLGGNNGAVQTDQNHERRLMM